jgi:hypothetical protein
LAYWLTSIDCGTNENINSIAWSIGSPFFMNFGRRLTSYGDNLLTWNGMFSGCRWRRHSPCNLLSIVAADS